MEDMLVLVGEHDEELGQMEKMAVHQKGLLHRAFSVLLFNEANEMLLQQRSAQKYHAAGLWTNACCSHPLPGETLPKAVQRRLQQELGLAAEVTKLGEFVYRAEFDNGLIEHEYDHVFWAKTSATPQINTDEVANWQYMSLADLQIDMQKYPAKYTPWFKLIMSRFAVDIKRALNN